MAQGLMELLAAAPLAQQTRVVTLRTSSITVRALTAREMETIQGVYPRPGPPLIIRPGTHPESGPMVANDQDPVYRRALEVWLRKYRAMEVAAAAGAKTAAGLAFFAAMPAADLRRWAEEVVAAITDGASDGEIIRVWNAVRDLSDPVGEDGGRIEAAKKALSELSPGELEGVLASLASPSATA